MSITRLRAVFTTLSVLVMALGLLAGCARRSETSADRRLGGVAYVVIGSYGQERPNQAGPPE
ncbi:MAG: hypothetical protein FJ077_09075 [Cyanobacteria bacterium K_DeepCast_35m_m2_023]|nr:hypothetical protein [Cyanobacteria bacterium K_DeepCast_35m_m2_023]